MTKYLPFLFLTLLVAFLYFSFAVLLLNTALVTQTLFSSMPGISKITLLWAIITSAWEALHHSDFFLLLTTALLVGINVTLSLFLLRRVQKMGKVSLSFGGGTMVGVFSAGCTSCGFSALSLFGFSGSVALLPLHGAELYIIAISLLTLSLYYNVSQLKKSPACSISARGKAAPKR